MERKWIIIAVLAALAAIIIIAVLFGGASTFSSIPSKATPPPLPV